MCTKITTLKSTFCQNTFFQCTIHMHSSSVKQNSNFKKTIICPPPSPIQNRYDEIQRISTSISLHEALNTSFSSGSQSSNHRVFSLRKKTYRNQKRKLLHQGVTQTKLVFLSRGGEGKIISERKQHNTVRYDWGKCAFNFVTN